VGVLERDQEENGKEGCLEVQAKWPVGDYARWEGQHLVPDARIPIQEDDQVWGPDMLKLACAVAVASTQPWMGPKLRQTHEVKGTKEQKTSSKTMDDLFSKLMGMKMGFESVWPPVLLIPCLTKHTALHHDACLCVTKAPSTSKAVQGAKNKEEKKKEKVGEKEEGEDKEEDQEKDKEKDKEKEGEKGKDGAPKPKAKPKARPKAEPKVFTKEEQVLMATKKCLRMAWGPECTHTLREQVNSECLAC
jgi:hypothetical protein